MKSATVWESLCSAKTIYKAPFLDVTNVFFSRHEPLFWQRFTRCYFRPNNVWLYQSFDSCLSIVLVFVTCVFFLCSVWVPKVLSVIHDHSQFVWLQILDICSTPPVCILKYIKKVFLTLSIRVYHPVFS